MVSMKRGVKEQAIESPAELAARLWLELRDLVEQGEISGAFAERVRKDLFEPPEPGKRPALKWSVWSSYVEGEAQLLSIRQMRRDL
jgi:hypothetical protein